MHVCLHTVPPTVHGAIPTSPLLSGDSGFSSCVNLFRLFFISLCSFFFLMHPAHHGLLFSLPFGISFSSYLFSSSPLQRHHDSRHFSTSRTSLLPDPSSPLRITMCMGNIPFSRSMTKLLREFPCRQLTQQLPGDFPATSASHLPLSNIHMQ